jgi:hypothetical protein
MTRFLFSLSVFVFIAVVLVVGIRSRHSAHFAAVAPPESQQTSSAADEPKALKTSELVKRSTRIVVAECKTVAVRKSPGGNIFTYIEFEVLQTIKGSFPSTSFTLRLFGGRIGNEQVDSPPIPTLNPGDKTVLLLGPNNSSGYPIFYSDGIFKVVTHPVNKSEIIIPKPKGLPLFRAKSDTAYAQEPELLPLEDFLFSISKVK